MKLSFTTIIISMMLVTLIFQTGNAQDTESSYVSHPGNIPEFKNYTTPQLKPGRDGMFNFSIKNRYDKDIENVKLQIEIYRYATIDTSKEIEKIRTPPNIRKTGNQNISFEFNKIGINETRLIEFVIQTNSNTNEGTYFVRCNINFKYNSTEYKMLSRGYFSNELWDQATENATKGDPGNINLTYLECDGIIPDSSFGVKNPFPRWPLYLFIFLSIFFAVLAIVFYIEDTQSSPWLNKRIQRMRGKFNQFRRLLKHRKK